MIVGWAPGTAQGRRIARDPDLEKFGRSLARTLGGQLARLHAIVPPRSELDFLGSPPVDPAKARIAQYRESLDQMKEARPVLEYALNWLEDRTPAPNQVTLCHADFRTGNYLVHDGELTAILDWEFAGWSDPCEDIGWFCARCWRFGRQAKAAGGIADRADFYSGYEVEAGRPIDRARIGFWEVMAHVRWSVIALLQEHRHLSSEKPVLELALTGQMIPEIEHDLLAEMSDQTERA
jgi:aminoglycoside phosphotransferase (APT) family kinase protein